MRKEILVTQSLDLFNKVRNQLEDNEIPYSTKVLTQGSDGFYPTAFTSRSSIGTSHEKYQSSNTYYIYVKKKYLALAEGLIK